MLPTLLRQHIGEDENAQKQTAMTSALSCFTLRTVPLLMVRQPRARRYLLRLRSDGTTPPNPPEPSSFRARAAE